MKFSKWTICGILTGLIFAVGSFIRYYILYPDVSEMVIGVSIGILIMAVSYLYNQNMRTNNKLTAVEDFIADKNET